MSILRRITTAFGFKVQDGKLTAMNQKVASTKRRLKLAAREASNFRRKMSLAAGATTAMFAVMAGSRIIKAFTTDYSTSADAIAKFSAATGLSTDFLQRFYHAMELGGATQAESEKGLKKFVKTVNDAERGLKTAKDAFKEIGVDPKAITADREGLLKLADAMHKNKDTAKVAAAAQDIFGKAALKFIPTMKKGRKAMQAYFDEADRLGKVMSKKRLKEAEEFNDQLLRAKVVVTGLRNQIAARLLPTLTRLLTRFGAWAREGDNLKRTLENIKRAAFVAGAALGAFITMKLLKNLSQMVQGFMALTRSIQAMGLAASLAQIKVALLVAALVLIPLIIQDLVVFAQGGDSLIGRILGDTSDADEFRKVLLAMGAELKKIGDELRPALAEAWKEAKPALIEIGKELKALGPIIVKGVILYLKILVKWLKFVPKLIRFIKARFSEIATVVGFVVERIRNFWNAMSEAINDDTRGIGRVFSVMVAAVKGLIGDLQEAWAKMIAVVGPLMAKLSAEMIKGWEKLKPVVKTIADFMAKVFKTAADTAKASWAGVMKMIRQAVALVGKVTGGIRKVTNILGLTGETPIVIPATVGAPISQVLPTGRGGGQTVNATVNKVELNVMTSDPGSMVDAMVEVRKQVEAALQDVINQAARNFRGSTV